ADSYALPLMRSEKLELVSDGCQHTRSQKTELIADWDISKKYLNVCCRKDAEENCSECHKCVRTLLPLDAMGKLDEYSHVFDLEKYRKQRNKHIRFLALSKDRSVFASDNYSFCKEKGMKIPSKLVARIELLPVLIPGYVKKVFGFLHH
ncbi:MAG: hypothetical protein IJK98_02630, partial [Clostridia bacterium]|nr:hypothetical protein [Clostridia bacterium]